MSVTTEDAAETKFTKSLAAYLNDHLASETLGLELATGAGSEHTGERLGTFLQLLSWELEEDRESLVGLMGKLGVRRRRAGVMLAVITVKAGRLKRTGSAPLSALAELESLHQGINGKLDMWNSLRASSLGDRVDGIDFDELIRRAEGQAAALEKRRVAVASIALSHRDRAAAARNGTPLAAVS